MFIFFRQYFYLFPRKLSCIRKDKSSVQLFVIWITDKAFSFFAWWDAILIYLFLLNRRETLKSPPRRGIRPWRWWEKPKNLFFTDTSAARGIFFTVNSNNLWTAYEILVKMTDSSEFYSAEDLLISQTRQEHTISERIELWIRSQIRLYPARCKSWQESVPVRALVVYIHK